ncbi:oligosaccharide flippase family protein [Psychroserpens sp. XS_ASV72]|uniref:oligosaccharide flippase family protein n=1 Tax=Psychroserpens sp. XS_ASV72 TaxID=3241293 RepID=UPI00351636CA
MQVTKKTKALLQSVFNDKDFAELLKGGATVFLLKILGMVLGYAIMLYITNNFGAKDYGAYAFSIVLLNILIIFPRFGLDNSLVRIITAINEEGNYRHIKSVLFKACLIVLLVSVLIVSIGLIFKDQFIEFIDSEGLKENYTYVLYTLIPFSLLVIIFATFQSYKNSSLFILFKFTLVNVFFISLLLVFKAFGIDKPLFSIYFYATLLTFVFGLLFFLKKLKNISRKPDEIKVAYVTNYDFKKIISISTPMLFAGSFLFIISWIDIIMIQLYMEDYEVGLYSVAQKISVLSSIFLFSINAIATPKFAELFASQKIEELGSVVRKSTKLIFYSTAPLLIVLVVFSDFVLGLNGDEFINAKTVLILLCIGQFIGSISGSVGYIMQMTNNQKLFQRVVFFSGILNLTLNFILIPIYGINGAAISTMTTIILTNISLVIIIKRKLGFWTFYLPFNKLS